jgi:hypothetical protein
VRDCIVIESIVRRTIVTTNVCAGDLFSRNAGCVERKLTGDLIWKNPFEMQISITTGMFIISKHYDRSNL